jgi:RNA polymerase sigma-70 factor (ECF subfamily)
MSNSGVAPATPDGIISGKARAVALNSEDDRRKQFFTMYVATESSLRRFLRLLVHDVSLLDEVSQSVALRLWERFDSYDAARPFDAWARGVATKVLSELRRSDRRFPRLLGEEGIEGLAAAYSRQSAESFDISDQLQALRECLRNLPDKVRELVVGRFCDSQSVPEIASRSGKTVPATYKALGRALERLALCVHRRLGIVATEGGSGNV